MPTKPKILKFTRRAEGEDIVDDAATERELQAARKHFSANAIVPASIWRAANSILAERSRALSFSTHRSYLECMREILHLAPHLRLGVGSFLHDEDFDDVKFLDPEAESNDDAT